MALLLDLMATARELLTAEVRQQRRRMRRFIVTAVIVGVSVILFVILGLGLVIWGTYIAAAGALGRAGGAFLVGGASILLAIVIIAASRLSLK